jgi:3-deoxy-manno-octulosonate cytidylyltransferase (CMP-KDO synthetase)
MSWEAAKGVAGVDAVYVATDDTRIKEAAEAFGADVIMTSEACENGTARCADALANAGLEADLIVNLQGDAPLTPAWFVEDLIAAMKADPEAQVATPVLQCDPLTYGHFVEDRKAGRVGGTTAVFNAKGHALYFSKEVLPYIDADKVPAENIPVYHHVGVYAYRPEALAAYTSWPVSELETLEGLEQLRFLVNDTKVRCVIVEGRGRVFWELNNPEDVPRIESVLKDL